MSTRTNTTSSRSANRGSGRGRVNGPRGHTSSSRSQNTQGGSDEYHSQDLNRRNHPHSLNRNTLNQHENRGNRNYRENKFGNRGVNSHNINTRRSETESLRRSTVTTERSPHESISSTMPKHFQNPFFERELIHRFNEMLPVPSFVEVAPSAEQQGTSSPTSTLKAILGMADCNPSKRCGSDIPGHQTMKRNINENQEEREFEAIRYGVQEKDRLKRANNGKEYDNLRSVNDCKKRFSDDSVSRKGETGNSRNNNDEFFEDFVASNHIEHCNYKPEPQPGKPITLRNSKSIDPKVMKKVSQNERKDIMQRYGFDISVDKGNSLEVQKKGIQDRDNLKRANNGIRCNIRPEPQAANYPNRNTEFENLRGNNESKKRSSDDLTSMQSENGNSTRNIANGVDMSEDIAIRSLISCTNDKPESLARKPTASNLHAPKSLTKLSSDERLESLRGSASHNDTLAPKVKRKVSNDERLDIMKRFGFDTGNVNVQSCSSHGKVSDRTTPRVRFNLMNEPQTTSAPGSSKQDKIEDSKFRPNNASSQHLPFNMEGNVAGRQRLNINRPARDFNERVPTRAEALERIQDQYEIQRMEYEAKIKEKEAKKREEYLARYKHVDQGHRLNDNLLDEAAGYAPGYNPSVSVQEVRQRQQEELRQQALVFQEREREEQERQKRLEEKKRKERLDESKNYDTGHRLGRGENQDYGVHPTETLESVRQRQQEWLRQTLLPLQEHRRNDSVNVPEIRQRQQEQMGQSLLPSQEHRKNDSRSVPEINQRHMKEKEEMKKELMVNKAKGELMEDYNFDTEYELDRNYNQGGERQTSNIDFNEEQPDQNFEGNERSGLKGSISPELLLEGETEEQFLQRQQEQLILEMMIQSQIEFEAQKKKETEEVGEKEIVEEFKENDSKNMVPQVKLQHASTTLTLQAPPTSETAQNPEDLKMESASCVLKNKNGAVLVLRPNKDTLNQALARRYEVQDEMDKLGSSVHYQPTPEQEPIYRNNRFDRNSNCYASNPPTGAIPKNSLSFATGPVSSKNNYPTGAIPKNSSSFANAPVSSENNYPTGAIPKNYSSFANAPMSSENNYPTGAIPKNSSSFANASVSSKNNYATGAISKNSSSFAAGPVSSENNYATGAISKKPSSFAAGPVSSENNYATGAISKKPSSFATAPVSSKDNDAFGALPKNTSRFATAPMSSKDNDATSKSETPQEGQPAYNHKAELRAARLKFQQNYDETLRKIQENNKES